MSISFYWLERVGRWGSSPSTSPADHQKFNVIQKWGFHFLAGDGWWMGFKSIDSLANHLKLNIIQKWAFHFFGWRGWWMGFESINQPSQSSEVECNPKMKHFIFWLERVADGVWVHWPVWPTSDVECYTKTSISCFWLERGGGWGSSQSSSSANHLKLNIIQKWAFHFFG